MMNDVTPAGSRFGRNALSMVLGSAASQGLLFVSLLLFARLYEPEAIGLHALVVSMTGLFVTLATLRLDLALVLDRHREPARQVAGQVMIQSLVVAAFVAVALIWSGDSLQRLLAGDVDSRLWVGLLPLMIVTGAAYQIG